MRRPDRRAELDRNSLRAVRVGVEERLRRSYRQSSAFVAETADEMVDEAYAEYAELPPARQAAITNLIGWLGVVAARRAID